MSTMAVVLRLLGAAMTTNCLNPCCRAPFAYNRNEGRIFTIDRPLASSANRTTSHHEQYWLCGTCSRSLKVIVEDGRIVTVPIDIETAALAG
jgi:hypothetical protein